MSAHSPPMQGTQPGQVVGEGAGGGAPMIRVEHVTKRIGEKTLVEDLTFEVYQGEIFGFIGPSGSGKTSTIRLLTGVYGPTEGSVRVMGMAPDHPSRVMQERANRAA